MKPHALVLSLVALAVGLVEAVPERSGASASVVSAVPRWAKGDKLALREEHSYTRGTDGVSKPVMAASAALDLEVLKRAPRGTSCGGRPVTPRSRRTRPGGGRSSSA